MLIKCSSIEETRQEILLKAGEYDKGDNCKQTVASVILVNTEEGLRAARGESSLQEEEDEQEGGEGGPRLMAGRGRQEQRQRQPASREGDSCGILGGRV